MWRTIGGWGVVALASAVLVLAGRPVSADTIRWALTQAYVNNPQINAARAQVRSTDETVPQALSGYRPRISLSAQAGEAFQDATTRVPSATGAGTNYPRTIGENAIQSYGATYSQTLLNGFGT